MELLKEFLKKSGIGIKSYIKSALVLASISFLITLIGLYIGEVPYYGLIALGISIVDLLPVLGNGIILIPWSIIAFASSNTKLALILILIFLITFVIEQVLQPLLLGKSVGLKPIYTLIISIVSMVVFTPATGAIIGSIISILLGVIIDIKNSR